MDGVEFEGGDHVKDDLYRNVAMFKGDVEVSWGFLSQPIAVATLKKIGAKKNSLQDQSKALQDQHCSPAFICV